MLSRRIARPMLATWFVVEGIDACRRPAPHVGRMRAAWRGLASRADLPQPPPDDTLRTVIRLHGAATAVAGLLLALGKAPRLAACSLAVLTIPLAVLDAPNRGAAAATPAPAGERPARALIRDLSLIGGAAIAALDREGHPSLGWRVQHARVDRDAELQARRAVASARKEARSLGRQAHAAIRTVKAHTPGR